MQQDSLPTAETQQRFRERGYANDAILPKTKEQRDTTASNFFTLWMGSIHNIPNYNAVIPFIILAVSQYHVMLGLVLSGLAVATLLTVNGRAGAKYGIPFALQLRSAYGVTGSKLPGFLRGVVAAIAWYGIQNFTGGMALHVLITQVFPGYQTFAGGAEILGIGIPELITFLVFTLINTAIGLSGGGAVLNRFTAILSPLIYIVFGGAAIWAVNAAGGIGNILAYEHPNAVPVSGFLAVIGIVNAFMGVWAAPGAGVADFTQNAVSQEDQVKGQYGSLFVGYLIFAVTAVFILTGGFIAYGPQSSILDIINQWPSFLAIAVATGTLLLSTISTNATGNIIPAGYQLSALFPKALNYRAGVLVATLISILIMPWNIANNITGFLNVIGALLGPVAGVLIADFYVIKQQTIDLDALYMDETEDNSDNPYTGTNTAAYIATIAALVITLLGNFIPALEWINNLSWFLGFGLAFLIYVVLKRR